MAAVVLIGAGVSISQGVQQSGTLVVSGYSGQAPVIQAGGRSYVDIASLAQLTNGSLSFNGHQVTLTLPGSGSGKTKGHHTKQAAAPPQGFSKGFLKAGIEAMADIREWRIALDHAVRYGFPPGEGDWTAPYRGAAATGISLASAAASTDDDQQAFQLLNNVFNTMQQLTNQMLQKRKNLTYIAPDALQNDPLDQKILACARALQAMAASNQFQDNASCH